MADGLPANIVQGLDPNQPDLLDKRSGWNRPAPAEVALPTETWREVVDRRKRYADIMAHLADGSVATINDFITYNLNIRVFAQDVLEDAADPKLILHFYRALESVSVLDPTCGSGAFLFAALNILEPLYETCLMRMQAFTGDEDEANRNNPKVFRNEYKEFRQILEHVRNPQHPNLRYFIYKSIILNNLYGVDIMREATEIAKLRLFLKLVATVDADYDAPNLGLEPLPDVDFNIRAGNTLIGFATEGELDRGLQYTIEGVVAKPGIEEKMELVSMAFERYKTIQLEHGQDDYADLRQAKHDLRDRLKALNESLNKLMHKQYASLKFADWCSGHKPFHWLAEFYEIVKGRGGFDVIIGNPPYVEYKDVKGVYTVSNYEAFDCADLYAFTMERSVRITHKQSRLGFIVPMSCFTVDGFRPIQNLYRKNNETIYLSNWSGDAHPAKLFEGVDKRLHIILSKKGGPGAIYTTKYFKWYAEERGTLFDKVPEYIKAEQKTAFFETSIPKFGKTIELEINKKIKGSENLISALSTSAGKEKMYYTRKVSFFLQFLDFVPVVKDFKGVLREPSELKELYFSNTNNKNVALSGLSSSAFYWFFISNSDCRNLNKREVVNFRVPQLNQSSAQNRLKISLDELMKSYHSNSTLRTVNYKNKGEITVQYFNFRPSKPIIDEIDKVLAEHYGFTNEELDFIVNYDIKYRMGREAEDGDE